MICDMTEQLQFVREIFTKLWFLPHCLSGEKSVKQAKIERKKRNINYAYTSYIHEELKSCSINILLWNSVSTYAAC